MPFSTLTQSEKFMTEGRNTYFADGQVNQAQNVAGDWKGHLAGMFSGSFTR
jgi:hypothetical protein